MIEFNKIESKQSQIGYRVELTIEPKVKNKYHRKEARTIISRFNKANPLEAKNEALALKYGWINILPHEVWKTNKRLSKKPISREYYSSYDDNDYYYHINIFCVREWGHGDPTEMIIYDSYLDSMSYHHSSKRMVQLLKGLRWEYELYRECGYSAVGAVEIIEGRDGVGFPIIFSAPDAVKFPGELIQ